MIAVVVSQTSNHLELISGLFIMSPTYLYLISSVHHVTYVPIYLISSVTQIFLIHHVTMSPSYIFDIIYLSYHSAIYLISFVSAFLTLHYYVWHATINTIWDLNPALGRSVNGLQLQYKKMNKKTGFILLPILSAAVKILNDWYINFMFKCQWKPQCKYEWHSSYYRGFYILWESYVSSLKVSGFITAHECPRTLV